MELRERNGNSFAKIMEECLVGIKNPQFHLFYCSFLVVYQKKYQFCLFVFQNMFIFAASLSPVTYEVMGW